MMQKTLSAALLAAALSAGIHTAAAAQPQPAQQPAPPAAPAAPKQNQGSAAMQRQLLDLSQRLWQALMRADTETAAALIDDAAVFVHMGATLGKAQELDAVRNKVITLKSLDVQEQSARFIGSTAVVLKKIRLTAVVNGQEVTNPFVVTEVYVRQGREWWLASMAYTRIVY